MPEIFYEKLLKNPDAQILINFPIKGARKSILAFMSQEAFSIGGTATWEEPGMSGLYSPAGEEAAKLATQILNAGNRYRAQLGISAASLGVGTSTSVSPQGQVRTVQSTIANWNGSGKLPLHLELVFLAYREDIDVRENVKDLLTCVYPIIPDDSMLWITAPNNYDTTQKNLITVQIGRWWKSAPIFLMNSCNFSFSKQVLPNGRPLLARGSIDLVSYRLLSADQVNSFFIG